MTVLRFPIPIHSEHSARYLLGKAVRFDGPPIGGGANVEVASSEECLRLVGAQLGGYPLSLGPPAESAFRKPLLSHPKTIPVITDDPYGFLTATSKDEDTAGEGVFAEALLAEPHKRIDALATIDRLDSHQDPHLWGELEHRLAGEIADQCGQAGGRCAVDLNPELAAPGRPDLQDALAQLIRKGIEHLHERATS